MECFKQLIVDDDPQRNATVDFSDFHISTMTHDTKLIKDHP
jgi:hypothetical protein